MGDAEHKEKKPKRIEAKIINSHSQTPMLSLPLDMTLPTCITSLQRYVGRCDSGSDQMQPIVLCILKYRSE